MYIHIYVYACVRTEQNCCVIQRAMLLWHQHLVVHEGALFSWQCPLLAGALTAAPPSAVAAAAAATWVGTLRQPRVVVHSRKPTMCGIKTNKIKQQPIRGATTQKCFIANPDEKSNTRSVSLPLLVLTPAICFNGDGWAEVDAQLRVRLLFPQLGINRCVWRRAVRTRAAQ